ncbi:hypothetical protein LSH36_435g01041 [Paralvinella palmiformis]|uniref:Uncharacterized protein n=1 Tax=Paralvinella palmiformis TaxID=53620 RepID=A0AAD9JC24_9ANNE|nr:hypothetical protein LSH36_435g01041 [Paralvinella palmiformis]
MPGDTEIELPSGVSHQPPDGRTIHGVPALRPCHFSPPPPPNSPPPPESPIYNPSYPGLLQRSKVGLVVADTSTQVHVTLRDSLSSEVSCDSYTSDSLPSSPRIQVTGEEERHITLERQKSDVAVFVKQMTELTEGVRQDDVIVVANDETEAVDTTVDVVQHNVLEQKESLKNRTEDQIVTEIIADNQYGEDPSSLDQVVGIQESSNIVPMSPHQEWCQGLLANDVMAADHGMSDEGIEQGTFEAVFPAETQIVTGTTSSAFVNGDAEEAASTEAIINPPDISLSSDTEYKAVYVGSTARKSNIESDIPIPPEKVPEESAVTILERTLNIPDRDGTPVMRSHSESSPEGSLSNFNIDEVLSESDTGDDILPDSSQPVQLVKKKILPEFTLNLEDEDDNDEEDDNRIDNSYEYTEVITGEITTVIKLEDYQAGLSSGGMMNQDLPSLSLAANENDQGVSRTETNLAPCESMLADRVTKIAVNSEQFGEGAWTGSSFSESESRTQIADVGLSDEINFDATDVTYVSPMTVHSDFQGEFSNWSPLESNMNLADSRECQPLAGHLDYCNQEQPSYSSDVQNEAGNPTECSENTVENNESMSPPGRMSLLSIVSEVKSKSDVKQHITPLEFVQDSEVADKVSHDAVDATSVQSTTPVFKSLRDAYKNKSEQEGQVLIIPKPEPFVLPPEASISKASTHGITSTTTAVVQDSKIPSGEGKLKQGDFNVQPLVYKKESLAVSRRAPRISALDLDEKKSSGEESSQRFWGPRPWSARENSDDVPSVDVKEVLMRSREAITRSRDLPLTSEIIEIVEKSTPQLPSNESVVGMYSPGKSTAQSGSPKDKCSDISFSPHSEEEESQAMMEEKSITMLAYPVERKSFPRQSSEPIRVIDGKQYNSSTTLDDTDVSYNTHKGGQESRLYNSTLGISELSSEEGAIVEPKPVSLVRPLSVEGLGESKEKAKKSLQQQYADLQQQFTKWQKQLMDNQRLLPTNQRNEQGGVSSLSNLTTEQQIARLKAEQNYMRLSTPRPFTHRTTDPQGFKPRPIIKKTADFEKQFVLPTAHTNYLDSTDTTFRTSTDDASLTPSIPPPPPICNPPKVETPVVTRATVLRLASLGQRG